MTGGEKKLSKTHLHFLFWFYKDRDKPDSVTTVIRDVIGEGKSEEAALSDAVGKANKMVDKDSYPFVLLKQVVEHHDDHGRDAQ